MTAQRQTPPEGGARCEVSDLLAVMRLEDSHSTRHFGNQQATTVYLGAASCAVHDAILDEAPEPVSPIPAERSALIPLCICGRLAGYAEAGKWKCLPCFLQAVEIDE